MTQKTEENAKNQEWNTVVKQLEKLVLTDILSDQKIFGNKEDILDAISLKGMSFSFVMDRRFLDKMKSAIS